LGLIEIYNKSQFYIRCQTALTAPQLFVGLNYKRYFAEIYRRQQRFPNSGPLEAWN